MLNKLPSIFRLTIFLLLSAGIHAGLVYYGWLLIPSPSLLPHAPVEVSFLPVVEVIPSAPEAVSQPKAAPVQPAEPLVSKKKITAPPQHKPIDPPKPLPKKNAKAVPEPTVEKQVLVCEPPEDALCSDPSEMEAVPESPTEAPEALARDVQVEEKVADTDPAPPLYDANESLKEAVPRYSSNPLPEYPYLARQRRWEGIVWLLVSVSPEGFVEDLSIEKTSGHRILDKSALRAVRRWRFVPATRAGLPAASKARIPVRFHLEGG